MVPFHKRFIQLRNERHLTQPEVAQAAGVTTRTYQRYESGEREPNVSTLIKIADFYGVSIDFLVGRTSGE